MLFCQLASELAETRTCYTVLDPTAASIAVDLAAPQSLDPSLVSCAFYFLLSVPPCLYQPYQPDNDERDGDSDETSSLLSGPGDLPPEDDAASKASRKSNHSHCLDVTGLALLYKYEFWQIWVIMGLLTGVGLMTIK